MIYFIPKLKKNKRKFIYFPSGIDCLWTMIPNILANQRFLQINNINHFPTPVSEFIFLFQWKIIVIIIIYESPESPDLMPIEIVLLLFKIHLYYYYYWKTNWNIQGMERFKILPNKQLPQSKSKRISKKYKSILEITHEWSRILQ